MSDQGNLAKGLELYEEIFRCESCSQLMATGGVAGFARRGCQQTLPVSHFVDIDNSRVWPIVNNRKGGRSDAAVATSCGAFGTAGRKLLTAEAIQAVTAHLIA